MSNTSTKRKRNNDNDSSPLVIIESNAGNKAKGWTPSKSTNDSASIDQEDKEDVNPRKMVVFCQDFDSKPKRNGRGKNKSKPPPSHSITQLFPSAGGDNLARTDSDEIDNNDGCCSQKKRASSTSSSSTSDSTLVSSTSTSTNSAVRIFTIYIIC